MQVPITNKNNTVNAYINPEADLHTIDTFWIYFIFFCAPERIVKVLLKSKCGPESLFGNRKNNGDFRAAMHHTVIFLYTCKHYISG